jgi:hypothetical protein
MGNAENINGRSGYFCYSIILGERRQEHNKSIFGFSFNPTYLHGLLGRLITGIVTR